MLNDEVINDELAAAKLREAQDLGTLPDSYQDHPVVERGGRENVYPLALYLDGTPYSKKDGVLV